MEQDPHSLIEGMHHRLLRHRRAHCYIYVRGESRSASTSVLAARHRRGARRGLPRQEASLGIGLRSSTSTCTAAPARTSAARRRRCSNSLEGKRGEPRLKPPFPAVKRRVRQPDHRQQRRDHRHRARHHRAWAARVVRQARHRRRTAAPASSACPATCNKPGVYELPHRHHAARAHRRPSAAASPAAASSRRSSPAARRCRCSVPRRARESTRSDR